GLIEVGDRVVVVVLFVVGETTVVERDRAVLWVFPAGLNDRRAPADLDIGRERIVFVDASLPVRRLLRARSHGQRQKGARAGGSQLVPSCSVGMRGRYNIPAG